MLGLRMGPKCKARRMLGCTFMLPLLHPCFLRAFGWSLDGAMHTKHDSREPASMPHPGLGRWSSRCENRIRLVMLIEMHRTRALEPNWEPGGRPVYRAYMRKPPCTRRPPCLQPPACIRRPRYIQEGLCSSNRIFWYQNVLLTECTVRAVRCQNSVRVPECSGTGRFCYQNALFELVMAGHPVRVLEWNRFQDVYSSIRRVQVVTRNSGRDQNRARTSGRD